MRISYNREVDILMVEHSEEKIEYAEEMDPTIVHFTCKGKRKPALIEILDANEFHSRNRESFEGKKGCFRRV